MKAVVFHGPNDARVEEIEKPVPGPGEVVCRVAAVGVCGTDIEVYKGIMVYFRLGMLDYPWVSGHEWAGIVDSVGEGVTNVKPGDRIVSEVTVPCGRCDGCRNGRPQMCWPRTEIGVTGPYWGAFAEYIKIPAHVALKLPEGVGLREAAMAEPAGVCMHGIDIMRIDPGDRVVVIGDGPIGVLSAQIAKAMGAIVVLVGSREYRMAAARETGLSPVFSRHDPVLDKRVIAALGETKADSIIETSGNPSGMVSARNWVKNGGKVLVLSLYGMSEVPIDLDYFVVNEIQIYTSLAASNTFPRVLRMMQQKLINTVPLEAFYPFDRMKEAIEDVANKRMTNVKTVVVQEDIAD